MYVNYWNLKSNPFLNVIDPRFLFAGEQHEEAIARFSFLAESGRLLGVLTGPYGVGKSTVIKNVAAAMEPNRIEVIRMDAIPGGQLPMAQQILESMKIPGPAATLPDALMNFWKAVENRPEALSRTLLCIDEAHYLAEENGLYLVHYLTNLRIVNRRSQTEEPLFTVILAGTPELLPAMRKDPSLYQRVQMLYDLPPFSKEQTVAYVQHHMRAVGGDLWAFDPGALDAIFRFSNGLPRKINLLCDTSLMLGFAGKLTQIQEAVVLQAAGDTGLSAAAEMAEAGERGAG